jgi:hypothetical protein
MQGKSRLRKITKVLFGFQDTDIAKVIKVQSVVRRRLSIKATRTLRSQATSNHSAPIRTHPHIISLDEALLLKMDQSVGKSAGVFIVFTLVVSQTVPSTIGGGIEVSIREGTCSAFSFRCPKVIRPGVSED